MKEGNGEGEGDDVRGVGRFEMEVGVEAQSTTVPDTNSNATGRRGGQC